MVDFEKFRAPRTEAPQQPQLPPQAQPAPAPPAVRLPPLQTETVRCESGREIREQPPELLWSSLGTLRWGASLCNVWHVGGEYNVTNCHCVGPKYVGRHPETGEAMSMWDWRDKKVAVRFKRGSNYSNSGCYPVGCDSALDYAVVRCPGQTGQVKPVKVTDPRFEINIGQEVHLLTYDVASSHDAARFSRGSVIQRVINGDDGARMQEFTSLAQGGNSGSAVFNKKGEVTCLLHSIDQNTTRTDGYARRSYCTNIHSVLNHMAGQGGELALARQAIRHSQAALELAERQCSRPPMASTGSGPSLSTAAGVR